MYRRSLAVILGVGSVFASTAVLAGGGGIDVSGVTSSLGEVETALAAVGGTLIGLAAVAVGFKWIKGMIFG